MAYFDWNATAPLLPEAREAWLEAAGMAWANPSTAYRSGVRARRFLEEARERMSALLGVKAEQVVFTSGATEANNGLLREGARQAMERESEIWISAVEHPSVLEAARRFAGKRAREIRVDSAGLVDLDWIEEHLGRKRPALLSLMAANNETGVIQPWETVQRMCREHGVPFHCDAVQWMGKAGEGTALATLPAFTLSGHKLGGTKGAGALVLEDSWKGLKVQAGGAQEGDIRAGTENIAAICAMVAAFEKRLGSLLSEAVREGRNLFEAGLREHWGERVQIHGGEVKRLWNTTSVCLPEFRSERWILQLDRRGFAVSSGSACSTGKSDPSTVLQAMGKEEADIRRTIRISGGWETQPEDWMNLLGAIVEIYRDFQESGPAGGPGKVIEI